jgi:thiaminase
MLISSKLKAQASEKLFQCLYHPFVVGLASGHLPRENFEAFLLQDAFYLQGFLKVL